jgi:hypothetical protein
MPILVQGLLPCRLGCQGFSPQIALQRVIPRTRTISVCNLPLGIFFVGKAQDPHYECQGTWPLWRLLMRETP